MYKRIETCWKFTPLNEDRHLAMLGEADVILHLGYKNCRSKAFPSKNICLAGGKTRDHQTLWIDIAFRESVNNIPWHVLLRPPSWSGFVALPFEQEGLRERQRKGENGRNRKPNRTGVRFSAFRLQNTNRTVLLATYGVGFASAPKNLPLMQNRQGMRTKNRKLINCSAYPGTL